MGSPTTTLNLSGNDHQDRDGRSRHAGHSGLPAALVSGKMSSDVTAISGDALRQTPLETMLDGTGGNNLSLAELNVTQGAPVQRDQYPPRTLPFQA